MNIDKYDEYDHDAECEAALHDQLRTLRAHKLRLDTELAEMRKINKQQMAFLQDAAAFIRSAHRDGKWSDSIILTTLIHDITGLANDERCFSPRVTGYAQREQEREPDTHWSQLPQHQP
jgi:Tfp pilus assembly protein PilN